MIPKNLYFIWLGSGKPSNLQYVAQMYQKINAEFKISVIVERNPEESANADLKECVRLVNESGNKYADIFNSARAADDGETSRNAAMSEAFRCFLLDRHGGIYVDCDTFPVRRFDMKLLQHKYFHGTVRRSAASPVEASSYFIGAEPGQNTYPGRMLKSKGIKPFLLYPDKLWENGNVRTKFAEKFRCGALKFGNTYEQFPTQYVNHYAKKSAVCVKANPYRGEKPVSICQMLDGDPAPVNYPAENKLSKISVVVITHNRTNVVRYTLQNLINYIKFDGQIKWIVADDRSPDEHICAITEVFEKNGIQDYIIRRTTPDRSGLGANMNNGLAEAFKFSPVALTAEDDFALEKDLDLTNWANLLATGNYAVVRLGFKERKNAKTKLTEDLDVMTGSRIAPWVFNNQVALRHRRVYDAIGMYPEGVSPDKTETEMRNRYNKFTNYGTSGDCKTLIPHSLKEETFDHNTSIFVHIGKSTCNHNCYKVPDRYKFLYDKGESFDTAGSFDLDPVEVMKNSFVISIDEKRILQFNRVFEKAGLTPVPKFFRGFSNRDIKSGPYKCELSHVAVVKTAKALDMPFVCIFEDDAYPAVGVVEKMRENLKNIPAGTKLLLIGWLDVFKSVRHGKFSEFGNAYGSQSYILFKSGYDDYLSTYDENPAIVADQFDQFVSGGLLRTPDNLFIQYSTGSMHGFDGYAIGQHINKNCLKEPPAGFYPISHYD